MTILYYSIGILVIVLMTRRFLRPRLIVKETNWKFIDFVNLGAASITTEELEDVTSTLRPNLRGEDVIGTLPNHLRKVWAFMCRLKEERGSILLKRMRQTQKEEVTGKEVLEAARQEVEISAQIRSLEQFFWSAVRAEFKLFDVGKIGLREDWTVVASDPICKNCGLRHPRSEDALFADMMLDMLDGEFLNEEVHEA